VLLDTTTLPVTVKSPDNVTVAFASPVLALLNAAIETVLTEFARLNPLLAVPKAEFSVTRNGVSS